MEKDFRGPFLGFTYGDIHSSEFNITRTSTSNRYSDDLSPEFGDKTIMVPGADQTYYFNTDFTQRRITVPFAFCNIDEETLARLRRWLNPKEPQRLIFDEHPYKYYTAKISAPVSFQFLAFDETGNGGNERTYKGEGTIQFVCYYPFAKSLYKSLEEWCLANNIPYSEDMETPEWFDEIFLNHKIVLDTDKIVDNKGDIPCDWEIYLLPPLRPNYNISCGNKQLVIDNIILEDGDDGVAIESKTNLLRGASWNKNKDNSLQTYSVSGTKPEESAFFEFSTSLMPYIKDNHIGLGVKSDDLVINIDYSPKEAILVSENGEYFYQVDLSYDTTECKLFIAEDKIYLFVSGVSFPNPIITLTVSTVDESTGWKMSNNIYNKYITAGEFFKLPLGISEFKISGVSADSYKLRYDYIYY